MADVNIQALDDQEAKLSSQKRVMARLKWGNERIRCRVSALNT
ncbi:MAG: hypothetical protein ABIR84_07215 [Candidatus Nitrotoga sp.]